MTTITRRSLVTITAALIAGLTLILLAAAMTTAQDVTTWATPVPVTPVPVDISALVTQLVEILRQIVADIIRGVLEPVAVLIGARG